MNEFLAYLLENLDSFILCFAIVLSNILGKPKTAEQLEAIREKRKTKLAKKGVKQAFALEKTTSKLEEIEKGD